MMRRSHLAKSGSWREWNRGGRSSPKKTISGLTSPYKRWMDGWLDGWMVGVDGWVDGWIDGWVDGWG